MKSDKKLIIYLTAGFPDIKTTEKLAGLIENCGGDIIELGLPFSDPVADGAAIQNAAAAALSNGMNIEKFFALTGKISARSDIPLYAMSYLNPIIKYGASKFIKNSLNSGIIGAIIPDLACGADQELEKEIKKRMDLVYMVAPNSSDERIREVISASTGFVYVVSLLGVTGARREISPETKTFAQKLFGFKFGPPKYLGFGISSAKNIAAVKKYADGVIIGSALIELLNTSSKKMAFKKIAAFISACRKELDRK